MLRNDKSCLGGWEAGEFKMYEVANSFLFKLKKQTRDPIKQPAFSQPEASIPAQTDQLNLVGINAPMWSVSLIPISIMRTLANSKAIWETLLLHDSY